jgi:hypothetical protein
MKQFIVGIVEFILIYIFAGTFLYVTFSIIDWISK